MARRRGRGGSSQWWTDLTIDHPRAAQLLHEVRAFLPPLNFITIHYAYFGIVVLVTSAIFWASSHPSYSISYTDSLFLTVSAMTEAGLNPVNLSQMTTWQQILLFLLILFGGAIWVSIWTVAFRLHAFEKHFKDIVRAEREKSRRPSSSRNHSVSFFRTASIGKAANSSTAHSGLAGLESKPEADGGTADVRDDSPHRLSTGRGTGSATHQDETAHLQVNGQASRDASPSPHTRITFADDPPAPGSRHARTTASAYNTNDTGPRRRNIDASETKEQEKGNVMGFPSMHNFLTSKTVGRNAQFHGLTSEERDHLGGCEYRALKVISVVVPLYFSLWQFLGCISLGAWIAYNKPEAATSNGLNPWWTGIFFGVSAFNNSGMALLDLNVIPFQTSYFVLIVMGLMILAGNTAYPVFLRFIFWTMLKVVSWATDGETLTEFKDTLKFILKYPRRVYTNMFPARQTWWLLFMVFLLNCIDWVGFEILNLGNPTIEAIPVGPRIIDGLFQGLAVRSGGFYLVSISSLYIGLQILYVIMMYISVYPVVITMRHSNVYEERSLGIYADDPGLEKDPEQGEQVGGDRAPSNSQTRAKTAARISQGFWRHFAITQAVASDGRISFISQQIQGQVAHDIWFLVLAVLIISVIETAHFLSDPVTWSVFNVIFEVVSAYGTVGISTGLPNAAYSFSGAWYTGSKLVLCVVMLRGRHRGLPVALDRAVRLPREQLHREEEEDHQIRRSRSIISRRMSVGSHAGTV